MKGLCRGFAFIASSYFSALLTFSYIKGVDMSWIRFAPFVGIIAICTDYGWKRD